jgi:hypothetical protein
MTHAVRKVGAIWLLGVAPLALAALMLTAEAHNGLLGFDFRGTLWEPARLILHGTSPYPPPVVGALDHGNPSVYPPLALWLAVPLAVLPFTLAYWTWTAILVAGLIAALYLLGVRDWRCYTLALGSCPVVFGIVFGNVALLLVPLAALVWHKRDDPRWSGVALGAAIAIKLVLWPLVFWLVAARRRAPAGVAVAVAASATFVAWAALGFAGLADYPRLLSENTHVYGEHSWSLLAGGVGLGLSGSAANVASWIAGLALLGVAVGVTRRPGRERHGFGLAVVSSVALMPVLWVYSLAVLLVPVALSGRRHGLQWYLFAGLWVAALVPRTVAEAGTPPAGVPKLVWQLNNSPAPTAQIGAFIVLIALIALAAGRVEARRPPVGV